jgi:hypothetical protein
MDIATVAALIISVGSLTTSILTHIRFSSCFGFKVVAYHTSNSSSNSTPDETTPIFKQPKNSS